MATVSLIKQGSEYSGGLNSKHVRYWNGPKTKLQWGHQFKTCSVLEWSKNKITTSLNSFKQKEKLRLNKMV